MKMSPGKKLALLFTLFLLLPLWWNQSTAIASVVTPSFATSKVEIVGEGETYQLEINNKVAKSTYKWSSSKSSVARVNSQGIITSVNKGTSTIKCKITYPNGKSTTLSSTVRVIIPATAIEINNATEENGAHIMRVGETFDFNRDIFPKNSSDKTFWSISGKDNGIIKVVNDSKGIVTALKPGKVILRATAARSATAKEAAKSIVKDAIIIEVVAPTATVSEVEFTDSTEIKIVFDSPINRSTVIGNNNKLLDNIQITQRKDTKGVLANDPGDLTATLSTDLRTLTIKTSGLLSGIYGISFTDKIKTSEGIALEEYYKQITFVDTIPPSITGVELDDSGLIVHIRFNEPIDISNLKASNATLLVTSGGSAVTASQTTLAIINNRLNYILSQDKKSLSINLSNIAQTDLGKVFSVALSGIKDLAGNSPAGYILTTNVFTDVTPRPQARAISVVRTSYNTLTVLYDRAIKYAGVATINGGPMMSGVIDPTDNKKVIYTMTEAEGLYTGMQRVSIGLWSGYNVLSTDTSANRLIDFNVNFTTDKTSPVLMDYQFDQESKVLTLTYNKDVNLGSQSGSFISTLQTVTNERWPNTILNYTRMNSTDSKVIKILLSGNMTLFGTYTFNLEQGFALDSFRNPSLRREITVSNLGSVSNELPAPYLITQSTTNTSQIYVEFAHMLDEASAQAIGNYSIPGVTVISARLEKNTKEAGSTVLLTVAEGTIKVTVSRPVTISGIKGYNGTYAEMSEYTTMVELKDNKRPTFFNPPVFDRLNPNRIILNFDEEIKGTAVFKVTQVVGSMNIEISNTVTIVGNSVHINLSNIPTNNSYLRIDVMSNSITDLSGNASTLPTTMGVLASYN